MYLQHDYFRPPKNLKQKCWRYLDFTKFIDLLDTSQLYFTRIDMLEDTFEGTFPRKTYELKNKEGLDYPIFYQEQRQSTLINCWHMNDYESAAMWKLYLKSDEGIAIQTSYEQLKEAFDKDSLFHNFIGCVKYIDYEIDTLDYGNTFDTFLHKRRSFEHEKEIRILIDLSIQNPGYKSSELKVNHGLKVDVNIEKLIQAIYVSPTSPNWVFQLAKSIVAKYNYSFDVRQSGLNSKALI